jgi:hypothetical protein
MHNFCHCSVMLLIVSLITYCLLYNYRTASSNSSKNYVKRIVHADIHSSDFEGNCIFDGSKLEERNQETLTVKCPFCNRCLVTEARTLADVNTT